jgi:selenocysteine-specific elongation factor
VLDAAPKKRTAGIADFLSVLASGDPEEICTARISRQGAFGLSRQALVAETGWSPETIEKLLAASLTNGGIISVGDVLMDGSAVEALKARMVETVERFHKQNPLVGGISREHLREERRVSSEIYSALLDTMVRDRKLELAGDLVRLPGRGVVMKDEEAESKKKIEEAFAAAGLKVPALHEVINGLKVDKIRAQKIVTLLLRDKVLIKISDELVFHRGALEDLRRQIVAQKAKSAMIDVAAFKQLTGVSRKYAIPLLEYLDRERVTKRVGDARQIL